MNMLPRKKNSTEFSLYEYFIITDYIFMTLYMQQSDFTHVSLSDPQKFLGKVRQISLSPFYQRKTEAHKMVGDYFFKKLRFNQVKFKDLIGFIEQFMNQAGSHLASTEEL